MSYPIESELFVSGGKDLRSFEKQVVFDAPLSRVFDAWATADGWLGVYAPDRPETRANIELAIGGRYEWLFDGVLGSNGCQVLSYIPDRMLSFSWNSPPTQAQTRTKRTWVVVEFEAVQHRRAQALFRGGFHVLGVCRKNLSLAPAQAFGRSDERFVLSLGRGKGKHALGGPGGLADFTH